MVLNPAKKLPWQQVLGGKYKYMYQHKSVLTLKLLYASRKDYI